MNECHTSDSMNCMPDGGVAWGGVGTRTEGRLSTTRIWEVEVQVEAVGAGEFICAEPSTKSKEMATTSASLPTWVNAGRADCFSMRASSAYRTGRRGVIDGARRLFGMRWEKYHGIISPASDGRTGMIISSWISISLLDIPLDGLPGRASQKETLTAPGRILNLAWQPSIRTAPADEGKASDSPWTVFISPTPFPRAAHRIPMHSPLFPTPGPHLDVRTARRPRNNAPVTPRRPTKRDADPGHRARENE
ncbi:hypothetical protein C8R44DRAFT_989430 [Mycena epipterygia]|nr:hypothetical protein C8R44DRAFT_989430 [Mycena epipterygia]